MQHATKRETIITITRDAFSTNDVRPFVTLRSFVPCPQIKKAETAITSRGSKCAKQSKQA